MSGGGVLYGLLALIGWGSADFLAGKLSRKIGNLWTALLLTAFSLVFVSAYFLISTTNIGIIPSKTYLYLSLAALFQMIAALSFYKGLTIGKMGLVSAIASPWSIVIVFYSMFFLQESITTPQILAIVIIVIGTVIASLHYEKDIKRFSELLNPGVLYALIALLGWGIGFIFLNQAIPLIGWLETELLFLTLTLIFLLIYIFTWSKTETHLSFKDVGLWKYSILAGFFSFAAYAGYTFGVGKYSKTTVATLGAAYPIATITLAYVFCKEKLKRTQLLGVFLVILGAILISGQ